MAVQIPDPGTGNGQTGDNEYVFRKKVKDNFSDQTNAASRLVGKESGNVMEVGVFGLGGAGEDEREKQDQHDSTKRAGGGLQTAFGAFRDNHEYGYTRPFNGAYTALYVSSANIDYATNKILLRSGEMWIQSASSPLGSWSTPSKFYHTGNTTKEPTTGYLKAASPILHLFNDDLTKEHEANEQDITVDKLGTGDYLIKGSTGLSEEGWSLSPPKDIHGNVLCMVEATEADGNINVKTYKRKFDFDIVAIVPDYDQPFDIPLGHSVDLRLNDLTTEI